MAKITEMSRIIKELLFSLESLPGQVNVSFKVDNKKTWHQQSNFITTSLFSRHPVRIWPSYLNTTIYFLFQLPLIQLAGASQKHDIVGTTVYWLLVRVGIDLFRFERHERVSSISSDVYIQVHQNLQRGCQLLMAMGDR